MSLVRLRCKLKKEKNNLLPINYIFSGFRS